MAQIAPDCKDTQDFQFKLHHKVVAFKKCGEPRSNVNLLAVSSSRGLLFAGSPTQPELKVIIVKDLVNAKSTGQQPQARLVTLPSIPNYIACNSDGNLLAVNYTQNGTGLLSIYAVISFMTPDVRPVSSIRLAAEDHVHSVQLLWNPVLPNSLAVVLSNGALAMYALKEGGHVEMHSLNKDQQVKCGCWSPKGKQIVLGFSGGTVKQFKPDLTLAKQILCPPNIHDAPFDTIAIQWLSTFQFAVIFLQHGEDCSPSLYILNAPKDGAPRYIKYYDICYSINGPRKDQFLFSHVPQWNLLLVVSANGVEVGIMGSTEAGDSPAWQQLTLLDEARIEMPLSEDKDETFPLGFAFDTSTTHQLTINEQKLQTMPMVHVLSSDGILLSFNFLNMLPTAVSVCSPPPPVADTSGQFKPLNTLLASEEEEQPAWAASPPTKAPAVTPAASSDISFAFPPNTVTSTPAPSKDKQPSLFSGFGAAAAKAPASQLSFGTAPTSSPLSFGAPATNAAKPTTPFGAPATNAATPTTPFGGFGTQATTTAMGSMFSAPGANAFGGMALNKPAIASVTPRTAAPGSTAPATPSASAPANKPLYTVPSTFTPVDTKPDTSAPPSIADESLKPDDIEPIIKDMIALQIEAFSQDIQKQKEQTKELFKGIAAPSALRAYAKRLDDLQELNDQAKDVEFELDVQGLRQGLNEAYAIVAECRGKLEIYRKPEITRLMNSSSCDPSGRRMLARLQSYVAANEAQLRLAQQHVDMQWEQFQDVVRRNSKSRMHMPCLEGIYQRLTRLQNLTSNQRILQNNIKAKLKERGLLQAALLDQEKSRTRTNEAVDTLADSILKMSLSQVVDSNAAKLSRERLQKIRNVVQLQKINVICPQRPDRVGLKSEVILETKRRAEQIKKAAAKPATANKYTQSAVAPPPTPNVASTPAVAPMPQASVAVAPSLPKPMPSIPSLVEKPGVPTTPAATSFSFRQSSPFVNTSTVTPTTNTMTPGEAAKPGLSIFGGSTSSSFSFGGGAAKSTLSFGAGSPAVAAPTPKPNPLAAVEKPTPEPTKPKEQNAALELKEVQPETEESKVPQKPKAETENKSFGFGGFTGTADTAGNTSSSPFSFGGLGSSLGFGGTAAAVPKSEPSSTATTNAATSASSAPFGIFSAALAKPSNSEPITTVTSSTTSITSKPTNVIASSSSSDAPSATNNSAPIGGLFSSVNICKPNTPADNTKPANIFGGGSSAGSFSFGGTTDASKGLFGSIKSVTSATTAPTSVTEANNKTDPISTTALTISTTTTTTAVSSPAVVPAPVTAAIPATSSTTVTSSAAVPGSAFSFSNAFSTLSAGGAVAPTTTAPPPLTANSPTSTSTGSNSSNSVFGGGFAAATSTAAPVANPFQSAAKSPVSSGNIFGSIPKPETSVFGGVATAPSNTTAAATPAAPPVGLFASAAISNPSPFGSPTTSAPASGVNIFGQAVKPSVFGQPAQAGDSGGSIFGGGSASTPFGSSSIFGGGNTQSAVGAPAAGSTSIFGQKVFGQSSVAAPAEGGNIFSNPVGSPQASPFGGGGNSIFGSPATASPASGGSIFGGGSSSGGFGSFTQTTPAQGGFGGGFGQSGGGSVAQTGFGSPQTAQQQTTTPGGFGAKPVFGGSPAFGASPTFGGGATFGSPKGFGGFGGASPVASPPPFGAAAKPAQGNIFETLGGQESGLSFGNLAQTGNSNAQKPAFGGSSFMNYR